ncbi:MULTISPECIES: hypothetical protein [Kitasatospora]|uniref:Gram-positive cocci surface proteins LPxTG domain-containing protein n=1 Tax=Kitasatospora setae (strain ATCC 33774 / DSM 43861 / JCM 3304 / KCC A-0304 / NBRC 14216 / KM-6054) TaxID=452652 RepID=E4NDD2_KITSK|nr:MULTISPECIES: hypothetical protein [Kitasatospora]BAJ29213.1 hypothetical protein KSE_34060 [Kitasatospora setae KM-6054]
MQHPRSRTLAASAALTVLALGAFAVPAQAAEQITLDAVPALSLPTDQADGTTLFIDARGTATTDGDLVVTYDTTGLAGIASLTPESGTSHACTTAGQLVTCTYRHYSAPGHPEFGMQFQPRLTALKGAPANTAGHLKVSQSWKGAAPQSIDVAVYAGGPRLAFAKDFDSSARPAGKPGTVLKQSLEITNKGPLESGRLVVAAELSPGLTFEKKFANCSYGTSRNTDPRFNAGSAAICTINTSVRPGQQVTVNPLEFKVGADALYPDIQFYAVPETDTLVYLNRGFTFTPASGTGERLTVQGVPETEGTKPGPPNLPGGENDGRDSVIVQYRVDSTADFAVLGTWTPSAGGRKGVLKTGVHNNGPASVAYARSGNAVAAELVTLPAGVTVDGQLPDGCSVREELPNVVTCHTTAFVGNGTEQTFDLPLAVADPAAAPKVLLGVTTEDGGYNNRVEPLEFDSENADNTAVVALGTTGSTAAPTTKPGGGTGSTGSTTGGGSTAGGGSTTGGNGGATATATASATSSAPATGSTGGTTGSTGSTAGGNLASTGGGQGTGTMLGLGIGAVVLGGGTILAVSRRRGARQR